MPITPEQMEKNYVYDGREVRLTGRIARKKKRSGKILEVWEICPLSVARTAPANTVYNKWCNPLDLLHIDGENQLAQAAEDAKKTPVDPPNV